LFTGNPELYQAHLQREGLNFRLLPLNTEHKKENVRISSTVTEKILHASIRAVPSNDTRSGISPETDMDANIYDVYIFLLLNSNSKDHSHMLVSKLLEQYHGNLPSTDNLSKLAILMINAGYVDEGKAAAEKYAKQLYQDYLK